MARDFHALDHESLWMHSFREGRSHVIALAGELCLSTADDVECELRRVELTAAHVIALDLRALTFIDSTGIHLILQASRRSSQGAGRLVVVRGSAGVHRLFELCGLCDALPFVEHVPHDDAIGRRAGEGALAPALRELRSRSAGADCRSAGARPVQRTATSAGGRSRRPVTWPMQT